VRENSLSFVFLDYSNDANRSRVKSRAIIRKALSNWQGDAERSVDCTADQEIQKAEEEFLAVDALIRIKAFEQQFQTIIVKIGICKNKQPENRVLALAAAIAHAELRLCEPHEFTLAPSLIVETLIGLCLDHEHQGAQREELACDNGVNQDFGHESTEFRMSDESVSRSKTSDQR
jgi:hypothetical protein